MATSKAGSIGPDDMEVAQLQKAIAEKDAEIQGLLKLLGLNQNSQVDWMWTCKQCKELNVLEDGETEKRCGFCGERVGRPAVAVSSPRSPSLTTTTPGHMSDNPLARFQLRTDQWRCPTCLIINKDTEDQCPSCETAKPRNQLLSSGAEGASPSTPSRMVPAPSAPVAHLPSAPAASAPTSLASAQPTNPFAKFQLRPDQWKCPTCLITNEKTAGKCVSCETPKPPNAGSSSNASSAPAALAKPVAGATMASGPASSFAAPFSTAAPTASPPFSFGAFGSASSVGQTGVSTSSAGGGSLFGGGTSAAPSLFSRGSFAPSTLPVSSFGGSGPAPSVQTNSLASAPSNGSTVRIIGTHAWQCVACMTANDGSMDECKVCAADRPRTATTVASAEWTCGACMTKNSDMSATECAVCNADRVSTGEKVGGWRCTACMTHNPENEVVCSMCYGEREEPQPSHEQAGSSNGSWRCDACTTLNTDANAMECVVCFAPNPNAVSNAPIAQGWKCPACLHINDIAAVSECALCFADRAEVSDHIDLSGGNRELLTAVRVNELLPMPAHPERIKRITLKTKSFGHDAARTASERLRRMTNIEVADFSDIIAGRPTDEGLAVLKTMCEALPCNRIRVLDLSDNAIGERGIRVLQETLRRISSSIEILNFRNNGLSEMAIRLFVEAIGNPIKLQGLHFYSNMSGDGGAKALAPLLVKLGAVPTLPFEFTMSSCRVQPAGAKGLCDALTHVAARLEYLDLSDSTMGEDGGNALAVALKKARRLRYLNLKDTGLKGSSVAAVMDAIGSLKQLEFLDFSVGPLKASRTKQLLEVLTQNCKNLQVLRLAENEARTKGIADLIGNPSLFPDLKELDLRSNEIDDAGARGLIALLANRTSLKVLELGENQFSTETVALLRATFGDKLGSLDVAEE